MIEANIHSVSCTHLIVYKKLKPLTVSLPKQTTALTQNRDSVKSGNQLLLKIATTMKRMNWFISYSNLIFVVFASISVTYLIVVYLTLHLDVIVWKHLEWLIKVFCHHLEMAQCIKFQLILNNSNAYINLFTLFSLIHKITLLLHKVKKIGC